MSNTPPSPGELKATGIIIWLRVIPLFRGDYYPVRVYCEFFDKLLFSYSEKRLRLKYMCRGIQFSNSKIKVMNLTKINFFPSTSILSSFEYNFVNYFLKEINLKILLRLVYYYKIENLKKNIVETLWKFLPIFIPLKGNPHIYNLDNISEY